MNQSDLVMSDIKMNSHTSVIPITTTGIAGADGSDKKGNNIMPSTNLPPGWYTTEDKFQSPSLRTLSLLSSSPTDVILSSTTRDIMFQQHHHLRQPHHHHQQQQQQPHQPSVSASSWPTFPMSQKAQRTLNPIRAVIDPILQSSNGGSSSKNHGVVKMPISLALGDPIAVATTTLSSSSSLSQPQRAESNHTSTTTTTTTALLPCPLAIRAVLATMESDPTAAAAYTNAIGTLEGRTAIARYHSHPPYYTYNPETDIIIANGCSGALEILLTSLLDQSHLDDDGTNTSPSILLVPAPGFPLYRVIAESHGATVLSYPLLPDRQWEIDVVQLRNILEEHQRRDDGKNGPAIRGIVINNPSNPTGAVYTTTHLQQIVRLCQEFFIPIIADEIYGDLIFPNDPSENSHNNQNHNDNNESNNDARPHPTFVSMARIAAEMGRIVPVVTASGIGKQFLLPGWRIGWICFQDNIYGSLQEVKDGAKRLAQIVLGASHLAQVAIPALLLTPPGNDYFLESDTSEILPYREHNNRAEYRRSYSELMEWKDHVRRTLHQQSQVLCTALRQIGPCLQVISPQGAMYAMVRINMEYFDESTIPNDTEFAKLLYQQEQVVVLPGTCFQFPNAFRVVFCAPVPILTDAAQRIHQFCHRHLRPSIP